MIITEADLLSLPVGWAIVVLAGWTCGIWSIYFFVIAFFKPRMAVRHIFFITLVLLWLLVGGYLLLSCLAAIGRLGTLSALERALLGLVLVFGCWLAPPFFLALALKVLWPKAWLCISDHSGRNRVSGVMSGHRRVTDSRVTFPVRETGSLARRAKQRMLGIVTLLLVPATIYWTISIARAGPDERHALIRYVLLLYVLCVGGLGGMLVVFIKERKKSSA